MHSVPLSLSIVIPVHNEEESLPQLTRELEAVATENDYRLEIVLIDDGSTDGSWEEIERLAREVDGLRGIRFRRNFGKAAALNAGFSVASHDIVFTLDGDLQDDPKEIPQFLEKLESGFDVVSGWKKRRHDPWHKVGPSRVFNWMVGKLTGVRLHDHNCGFKCYRKAVVEGVDLYGELHRFVPVLAAAKGWKVGELVVQHRARQYGHSKYGVWRIVKGFLDLTTVFFLTGYSNRPQHFLGAIGLGCFFAGGIGLSVLTLAWVLSRMFEAFSPVHLHERAIFFYSLAGIVIGAQLMTIGIIAEMITAFCRAKKDGYTVQAETGTRQADESVIV